MYVYIYVSPWPLATGAFAQRLTVTAYDCEHQALPARFAWLAGVTLIVIASTTAGAATAARTSTAEATFIGLGASFIDVQSASAKFLTVQRGNCLFGFGGVGHFDAS